MELLERDIRARPRAVMAVLAAVAVLVLGVGVVSGQRDRLTGLIRANHQQCPYAGSGMATLFLPGLRACRGNAGLKRIALEWPALSTFAASVDRELPARHHLVYLQ
jgi:hypothetical protein